MDDAIDLGVGGEDLVESGLVGDVGLVEAGPLAADELDAVEGDLGRVVETIDNDDVVAVLQQGQRGERADVARATARSGLAYGPSCACLLALCNSRLAGPSQALAAVVERFGERGPRDPTALLLWWWWWWLALAGILERRDRSREANSPSHQNSSDSHVDGGGG